MKNKNPLYVVKGKNVEPAKNFFELIVKKLNLEPAMELFTNILKLLLAQVTSYPAFVAVKTWFDQMLVRVFGIISAMRLQSASA